MTFCGRNASLNGIQFMTDVSEENVVGVTCDGFMLAWESTKL